MLIIFTEPIQFLAKYINSQKYQDVITQECMAEFVLMADQDAAAKKKFYIMKIFSTNQTKYNYFHMRSNSFFTIKRSSQCSNNRSWALSSGSAAKKLWTSRLFLYIFIL